MTREEWIKVRAEPYIPLGVWFSYYRENGGLISDPIFFEERFNKLLSDKPIYLYGGYLMHLTPETAKNRLFGYYDTLFGIL